MLRTRYAFHQTSTAWVDRWAVVTPSVNVQRRCEELMPTWAGADAVKRLTVEQADKLCMAVLAWRLQRLPWRALFSALRQHACAKPFFPSAEKRRCGNGALAYKPRHSHLYGGLLALLCCGRDWLWFVDAAVLGSPCLVQRLFFGSCGFARSLVALVRYTLHAFAFVAAHATFLFAGGSFPRSTLPSTTLYWFWFCGLP